jgi:outer membrane protein assembly factor BamB
VATALVAVVAGAAAAVVLASPERPSGDPIEATSDTTGPRVADLHLDIARGWSATVAAPALVEVSDLVRDGAAVYAVAGGALYRIDGDDGHVDWRHRGRTWLHVGPAVAGQVVAVAGSGYVVGVDAEDGRLVWALRTSEYVWDHLTGSADGIVATGHRATPGGLVATVAVLEPASGTVRWTRTFPEEWAAAVPTLLVDDVVIAATYDRASSRLRAFDLDDGEWLWQEPTVGLSRLVAHGGAVYAASGQEVAAFALDGGAERWRTEISLPLRGSGSIPRAAVVDRQLVVVAEEPEPVAVGLGLVDGAVLWERDLPSLAGGGYEGPAIGVDRPGLEIERPAIAVAGELDRIVAITVEGQLDGSVRVVDLEDAAVWEQHVDAPLWPRVWADPAAGGGELLVSTAHGDLIALSSADGEVRWRARTSGWGSVSAPMVTEGLVVSDQATELVAVSASDGQRAWTVERSGRSGVSTIGPVGSVFVGADRRLRELDPDRGAVIAGDQLDPPSDVLVLAGDDARIYAGSGYGVHAFDGRHRRQRWRHATEGEVRQLGTGSAAVAFVTEDRLEVLEAADGIRRWRASVAACTRPVIAAGTVAVGTERGLVGFDLADGDVRWRMHTPRPVCADAAADGELLYVTDLVRTVIAVDAETGDRVWRAEIAEGVAAPPGTNGELVAVPDLQGGLHLLDAADGSLRDTSEMGARAVATPTVTADAVVVLDLHGRLRAHPTDGVKGR